MVETKETVAAELYNQLTDPQENRNIANLPENAEICKKLEAKLQADWRKAKPNIADYSK
jgi:hypothetical protein